MSASAGARSRSRHRPSVNVVDVVLANRQMVTPGIHRVVFRFAHVVALDDHVVGVDRYVIGIRPGVYPLGPSASKLRSSTSDVFITDRPHDLMIPTDFLRDRKDQSG